MSVERCSRCCFWLQNERTHQGEIGDGDIGFGSCRRRAPVVLGELAALSVSRPGWGRDQDMRDAEIWPTDLARASAQPVTESNDWCGEFAAQGEA